LILTGCEEDKLLKAIKNKNTEKVKSTLNNSIKNKKNIELK